MWRKSGKSINRICESIGLTQLFHLLLKSHLPCTISEYFDELNVTKNILAHPYHVNTDSTFHNKSDFHNKYAAQWKIFPHNQDQPSLPKDKIIHYEKEK